MADVLSAKEIDDLLDALMKEEDCDKKDYSVLMGMAKDSVNKIKTAFDKGYKQGYENGVASQGFTDGYTEEKVEKREKEAYQKGLEKAWETAKYIASLAGNDVKRREIIGDCAAWYAFTHYTASEVIAKIEAYEQKQNEIKVGDEVIYKDIDYPDTKGVVIQVDFGKVEKYPYNLMLDNGDGQWAEKDDVTKTGRHFDQIEEVLKALKEG